VRLNRNDMGNHGKNVRSRHQPVEDSQHSKNNHHKRTRWNPSHSGQTKRQTSIEIQSYLFLKEKGWTLEKAKEWFEKHNTAKEHVYAVLPFVVAEKVAEKPLKIRGLAMTTGISRNFNIYTPEEL
jgi:hypothetical protein